MVTRGLNGFCGPRQAGAALSLTAPVTRDLILLTLGQRLRGTRENIVPPVRDLPRAGHFPLSPRLVTTMPWPPIIVFFVDHRGELDRIVAAGSTSVAPSRGVAMAPPAAALFLDLQVAVEEVVDQLVAVNPQPLVVSTEIECPRSSMGR